MIDCTLVQLCLWVFMICYAHLEISVHKLRFDKFIQGPQYVTFVTGAGQFYAYILRS